jgi:hypothetical protein
VSKAAPQPDRRERRIRANAVRDFDHKVSARFFGRKNAIEGDQRKCGQYCDPELHVSLPVFGSLTANLIRKGLAAVK